MIDRLPYKKKYCQDCVYNDLVSDAGGRDKWFCFGITSAEQGKLKNIPDLDIFRFCVHGSFEPVRKYFQLNMNEQEVKKIVERLGQLLMAKERKNKG